MSEENLNEIKNLLEDIKTLLILTNQEQLNQIKKKLVKPKSLEEKIYKLCDGSNTTVKIAKKIEKSNEYTGAVISTLRQKGLIKTVEKNGTKVHEQRF